MRQTAAKAGSMVLGAGRFSAKVQTNSEMRALLMQAPYVLSRSCWLLLPIVSLSAEQLVCPQAEELEFIVSALAEW